MITLTIDPPSTKQKLFLKAKSKHIAFGGARGGGKSWGVRTKAKLLASNYGIEHKGSNGREGIKIGIVRLTYQELYNNHINFLRAELNGIANYNNTEKIFKFPNGATIKLLYCSCERDLLAFQGSEFDVLFLEEATNFQEMWIKKMVACVRGANGFPKRIYYTMNPGGVSHAYLKRLFIDRVYEEGENPDDYEFIQSLVTDNKILMKTQPDYIRQLEALPPKLREAWLHGRWDIFEGQFFEDFRTTPDPQMCHEAGISVEEAYQQHRFTHVIPPFDLNSGQCRGWNIMRSYDFGYNKPFSLGYWAVDYDGTLYRIMEWYGCTSTPDEGVKWTPDEQFRKIAEFERQHEWLKGRNIVDSVADPAIWDSSRGESIADTAAKYGIYFSKGDNERVAGWMQVHYRMQFDENGYARMYIFDTCKAFIRTMPLMMYSETHPEDLDTKLEDHIMDETRYMCMSRPVQPIVQSKRTSIINDPLNQFTKEQLRKGYY